MSESHQDRIEKFRKPRHKRSSQVFTGPEPNPDPNAPKAKITSVESHLSMSLVQTTDGEFLPSKKGRSTAVWIAIKRSLRSIMTRTHRKGSKTRPTLIAGETQAKRVFEGMDIVSPKAAWNCNTFKELEDGNYSISGSVKDDGTIHTWTSVVNLADDVWSGVSVSQNGRELCNWENH